MPSSDPAPSPESTPALPSHVPTQGWTKTALAVWTWFELGFVSGVCFFIIFATHLLIWPFDKGRVVVGRGIHLVSVLIVKLTPLWDFSVHGPLPAPPGRTVCVSNHCSHTDPFLVSHLPWEIKWLAKASLFPIPFVGWGMWLAGDIPLKRGSPQSTKQAMARCAKYLEMNVPVMIFPEGTRSRDDELLPFKDGAFRLAIDSGADILPMAVAGTATALRKGDWRASYSRGMVTVGQPISTKGMTEKDVPRLKEMAREKILELRAEVRRALAENSGAPSN